MKDPKYYRVFKYDKKLLPNKYLARLEKGVSNIEAAQKKTGFTVGYPGWNLLYYSVFCSLRDTEYNVIIETGTNVGCSTIMLAQALKDSGYKGEVHSVELEEDNYIKANKNLTKAKCYDYVHTHRSDSLSFLSEFSPPNNLITFAFLDGCHDEDHLVKEFSLVYPFLDHKSIVFFDNTYLIDDSKENRRVNGALKQIKSKYGGNLINYENTSWYTPGQAIWQKDPFVHDWSALDDK